MGLGLYYVSKINPESGNEIINIIDSDFKLLKDFGEIEFPDYAIETNNSNSTYTLKVEYIDGGYSSSKFIIPSKEQSKVEKKAVVTTKKKENEVVEDKNNKTISNPKTSDNLIGNILYFNFSLVAILIFVIYYKKKKFVNNF